VSGPARLLSIRLQGFKSFAERTHLTFGPGISAVVGPNGSGKSNLADALRWALGEQGRALRTRRAEDVIWAGSERRAALGMADVQLTLDNADGLLPVEYAVVEVGRRLYRSGENDYLLNRQRVRLRDLVDLLDGAHLAENAFLFIGQGMVDQALALRPEERRPLFEEVAGVRRHERRRRRAEEQLAEAEENLARVEDIIGELRPQARRLSAQADLQATRTEAIAELTTALLASAWARWHDAAARVGTAAGELAARRSEVDAAMAALGVAEQAAAGIAERLATRGAAQAEQRSAVEAHRSRVGELELGAGRIDADLAALARDRSRISDERARVAAELERSRLELSAPVPVVDADAELARAEAERALGEALAELEGLRSRSAAEAEEAAVARRAAIARAAEVETARRRADDAGRRVDVERQEVARLDDSLGRIRDEHEAAADALQAATEAEAATRSAEAATRVAQQVAEAEHAATARQRAEAEAGVGATAARLELLRGRLGAEEARGLGRLARRRGGRRLDEELGVDPGFRAAVEAVLGDAVRGYLVASGVAADLAAERGTVIVAERVAAGPGQSGSDERPERAMRAAAARVGGGLLADAVQRDGRGAARALLARVAWVPDLAALLEIQAEAHPGWRIVTRDGAAVADALTVRFGAPDGVLEWRTEVDRLAADLEARTALLAAADASAVAALSAAEAARAASDDARLAASNASADRRRAEELERARARESEAALREHAWHVAQLERLEAEQQRTLAAIGSLGQREVEPAGGDRERPSPGAIAAWEARAAELRARRDRIAGDVAALEAVRSSAEARRAGARAASELGQARLAQLGGDSHALADRERDLVVERDGVQARLAAGRAELSAAIDRYEAVVAEDAADRERLATVERDAARARDELRLADERARAAERTDLEAQLGVEALREQLLVELAGLGDTAVARLLEAAGVAGGDVSDSDADVDRLEWALGLAAERWQAVRPDADLPSPSRLTQLRRRLHELGAANPYAVDEYREVRTRLEGLEAQDRDLRAAITRTRELIAELDDLIQRQFRTTFHALEAAFDARFRQLFGGGFARLVLTDPTDLGSTGVEITARPPGKKPQTLAMLSGGERALTAVALLFAMLEVRPVPFCVLDEVDAALDEANIGRFTAALRELASATQFVVITHNRGTIEVADALYGVTVGDDSVSRVISLRLEEAQAIAARRASPDGESARGAGAMSGAALEDTARGVGMAAPPLDSPA
jgi:chromosome segregation protein